MPKPARPNFKPQRRRTFIKQWRKHRGGMSLEKLAERLTNEAGYTVSEGQLSRIERGEQPYTQDLLEALAVVLNCEPPDLLNKDPTQVDASRYLWERLPPTDQARALRLLEASRDGREDDEQPKSGTGG